MSLDLATPGNGEPLAHRLPEPWECASGNARQLFYGLPKATCQATSGVTSGILVGCTPPRSDRSCGLDGVLCYPGNPRACTPLRLHAAYTHISREPWGGAAGTQIAGALGSSEPLAMPGNCFMGSRRQTCQVTSGVTSSGVTSGILVGCTPPRSDRSCGQK